jgi:hypothetical protein
MPKDDDPFEQWRAGSAAKETHKISLPSGKTIAVRKHSVLFDAWSSPPIRDTYGGKTVVNLHGEELFAELAILYLVENDGFEGVWVDTYRNRFLHSMAQEGCTLPAWVEARYEEIAAANGSKSGCWDVLAWRGDSVLFVECKRKGKDRIQPTQERWLAAAFQVGVGAESFLICEWDLKAV